MTKSKIETYLGFCIRAKKIVFGVDNVEKQRKGIKLLIADGELGQNSLKVMKKTQERFDCPLLITENGILSERLHRDGVKAVAITDDHLASAILSAADGELQFKIYSGGNN
ncbi:MAG: hypothetical protein IJX87_03345 [Clostridia bacterium]|nr:hypothetical protein [Clostridia bacterium]